MANTTTSKNQQPQRGESQSRPDEVETYPEWIVICNAGTDDEEIWSDHYTFYSAEREFKQAGGRTKGFDIMKRLPNGSLRRASR